ncbi:MAG: hypothetical protein U1F43_38315 [Myxococcota bacterium]
MIPEAEQGLIVEDDRRVGDGGDGPVQRSAAGHQPGLQLRRDRKTDAMSIETTREEWLTDMLKHDRLLHHARPQAGGLLRRPEGAEEAGAEQVEQRGQRLLVARKLQDKIEGLYEGIGAYKARPTTCSTTRPGPDASSSSSLEIADPRRPGST